MFPITLKEAKARFKEVSVASLAVVEEKPGKYRCLQDASNSVQVNNRIKVLDGEMCPSAIDIQAAFCADHKLQKPILGLVLDVEKAHRQVPVREEDWGYLACSTVPKPTDEKDLEEWALLVNTVGTYGVASASWHWARAASLFQRICYYICGMAYIYRYADDFLCLSANSGSTKFAVPLVRFLMLCSIVGIPLKWSKTRGGLQCEYVGYFFDFVGLKGGLSRSRAQWLIDWALKTANNGMVSTRECRAALGRFAFSAVLLRHLLPFLGPFYAWSAALDDSSVWPLPAALIIMARWLAAQLAKRRLVDLRLPPWKRHDKTFKADARADGDIVVIGGFESNSEEDSDLHDCRWFSISLDPVNCAWAFEKHGEAFRCIAALELLATLVCIMVFQPEHSDQTLTNIAMTALTDNQGNEALVVRNLTSKYPLYLVLLELAEQLDSRQLQLELRWTPREKNQGADDLTNFKFEKFDVAKRIIVELAKLPWIVLPQLLTQANELHRELERRKELKRKLAQPDRARGLKKRKNKGLRTTDPW